MNKITPIYLKHYINMCERLLSSEKMGPINPGEVNALRNMKAAAERDLYEIDVCPTCHRGQDEQS